MTRHGQSAGGAWILVLVGIMSWLPGAEAQIVVAWNGPPGCQGTAEIDAEVARLLPDASERPPLVAHVDVRLAQVDDTEVWNADVRLMEGESELGGRSFEATSCEELRGAVALLVVLAVDPDAIVAMEGDTGSREEGGLSEGEEETSAQPGSEEDAGAAAAPGNNHEEESQEVPTPDEGEEEAEGEGETAGQLTPPAEATTTEPEPESPSRAIIEPAHWGAEARVGVEIASLPNPSPVFSLGAFHQRKRFAIGLFASVVLPQNATTSVDASGRLAYGAVRATPGYRLRLSRLLIDVRSVVELGVMAGRGQDVAGPQTGYSLWAALGAEVGLAFRIGPISVGIVGDLRFPLNRPLYAFRGPLDVYRTSAVVGRTELSLQLHFR